ncbi:Rnf-Nqr domain containing protein [Acetanaerobacterium elongatum]|uniref:Electron transport complex protein RnfA n=1 Tax=Acetanaerobacterium elongatum TaxID=258515 RepID=A0A1G9Y039_9FIRM|nr:Rnf-Nqr domain containing protein [Acetanaerobacterium elongatum]SDN01773.1 electron transport complex protein RnfA [Acetanaerobacterium elongatum]
MELLAQFFSASLLAIFVENLVLSRGLGTSTVLFSARGAKPIFMFGGLLTLMTTLSSMAAFGVNLLVGSLSFKAYVRPLAFILAMTAIYYIVYFTLGRFMKSGGEYIRRYLGYATFNCAVLGSAYLVINGKYDIIQTLGFGIGAGVGFTLASLLIAEGRRRVEMAAVPKAFKGLPVTLLYIGILSLAFFGFIGHQLPF